MLGDLSPSPQALRRVSQVVRGHLYRVSTFHNIILWGRRILSKCLIRGFGSNACCAGPERLFTGTALSDNSSMKSLTIKSLFENFSKVKLGPLGNNDLGVPEPLLWEFPFREAIVSTPLKNSVLHRDLQNTVFYQHTELTRFSHVMCNIREDAEIWIRRRWPVGCH
jgi:hypothetical protein